jgi:hypothetical protein
MSIPLAIEDLHAASRKPLAKAARGKTTGIATVIAGVALIGLAAAGAYRLVHPVIEPVWAGDRTVAAPASETAGPGQGVGGFTGAYENGLPVYRFPPVQVTAIRKMEQTTRAE